MIFLLHILKNKKWKIIERTKLRSLSYCIFYFYVMSDYNKNIEMIRWLCTGDKLNSISGHVHNLERTDFPHTNPSHIYPCICKAMCYPVRYWVVILSMVFSFVFLKPQSLYESLRFSHRQGILILVYYLWWIEFYIYPSWYYLC